jgi:hypothetical protein
MPQADNREEFEERWNEYIEGLSILWNSLPREELQRLEDAQDELKELVEIAAEEAEEDD